MFGLGIQELLIVLGAGKLLQIGSSLGQGIRNFKRGIRNDEESAG